MIVALVSSYREGHLLKSCVRSTLGHVDATVVFEGPVDGSPNEDDAPTFGSWPAVVVRRGVWDSDAEKRSALLAFANANHVREGRSGEPLWVLWLDGDEVLLWGEYLRDWVARAEHETGAGGFAIRLVELDGSVAKCHGKIIRGDLVKRYLHSSLEIELLTGMVVALPNVPLCGPGGTPTGWGDRKIELEDLAELRPPLAGEPHLLHRSALRDPARGVQRLHEKEAEAYR